MDFSIGMAVIAYIAHLTLSNNVKPEAITTEIMLELKPITDFIDYCDENKEELSPEFQREYDKMLTKMKGAKND